MAQTLEERRAYCREYQRRRRAEDPEGMRLRKNEWRKANPDKTRAEHVRGMAKRRVTVKEWRKNNREKYLAQHAKDGRKDRALHPLKHVNVGLRCRYGITLDQYNAMVDQQGGLCAICGKPETRLHLGKLKRLATDHCHERKKVRALLCHQCNTGIGSFGDDPARLRAAADYLERHKAAP